MFLPPNVTSILQPMDQNVLKLLKLFYRNTLLNEILSNDTSSIADVLKAVDLRRAITLLCESWHKVKPEVIEKCWNKILDVWDREDEIPLSQLVAQSDPCNVNSCDVLEGCYHETIQLLNSLCPGVIFV